MNWEQIQTAGMVIFAVLGGIVTIGKAVDVVRSWFRPAADQRAHYERLLSNDKARLDTHEKEIHELRDGQRVICSGVQALLDHALHDGNTQQMQDASNKLTGWLINK